MNRIRWEIWKKIAEKIGENIGIHILKFQIFLSERWFLNNWQFTSVCFLVLYLLLNPNKNGVTAKLIKNRVKSIWSRRIFFPSRNEVVNNIAQESNCFWEVWDIFITYTYLASIFLDLLINFCVRRRTCTRASTLSLWGYFLFPIYVSALGQVPTTWQCEQTGLLTLVLRHNWVAVYLATWA